MFYLVDDVFLYCYIGPVRFSYNPSFSACFSAGTVFRLVFSAKRTVPLLDVDSVVDGHINRLFGHILELVGATPTCSTLSYWLFTPCQLQGQINCHVFGPETDHSCVEAKQIFGFSPSRSSSLLCVDHIAIFLCQQHYRQRANGHPQQCCKAQIFLQNHGLQVMRCCPTTAQTT